MPSGLANFVLETATNPGTGSFVLNGAPLGRVAFSAVFGDGQKIFYFADDGTQAEWGVGTLSTSGAASLARTTIAGNTLHTLAPLNFTATVQVYNEIPASFLPILEADGSLILQALTVRGEAFAETPALDDDSKRLATTEYIKGQCVITRPDDDEINSPVRYLAYFNGRGVPWLSVAKASGTFTTSLVQTNPGGGFYQVTNLSLNAQGQPIFVSSGGGTSQGITTFSDASTDLVAQVAYQHVNDYLSFNIGASWVLGATQSWTIGQIASEAAARANADSALQAQVDQISAGSGVFNGHGYTWTIVKGVMTLSFVFDNNATGTPQKIMFPKKFGGTPTSVNPISMTKDNDVWAWDFETDSFMMQTPNGGNNTFSCMAQGAAP